MELASVYFFTVTGTLPFLFELAEAAYPYTFASRLTDLALKLFKAILS